jgi:hypothetical protein
MPRLVLSASLLKKRIENKAYAYGVSSVVAALIGEYVIDLLRGGGRLELHAEPATH